MERLSRRSFMKIAGAATGAAALASAPPIARAAMGEEGAQKIDPKSAVPEEPLVAYVRDAERFGHTTSLERSRSPVRQTNVGRKCYQLVGYR